MSRRFLILVLVLQVANISVPAQRGEAACGTQNQQPVPACDRIRALGLVQQVADDARSIEKASARVATTTRIADLLWTHDQPKARALFTEAYEVAAQDFAKQGDAMRQEGRGLVRCLPDLRFVVLRAIAKRDPGWARRLAEQAAEGSKRDAEQASTMTNEKRFDTGEKLLRLADSLLETNRAESLSFARASFRYPVSFALAQFLYSLARKDQALASQLYREALGAYANGTTEDFVYLAIYPFGLNREIAQARLNYGYLPPPNFRGDAELQRLFLNAFLRFTENKIKSPPEARAAQDYPAHQLYASLISLEQLAARTHPSHLARIAELKNAAGALLTEQARRSATGYLESQREWEASDRFTKLLDEAEQATDPKRRDQAIAFAAIGAKSEDEFEKVESLLTKLSDETLRRRLFDYIYFKRTQKAVADNRLDDAMRFAAKVEELDGRAQLNLEIASALLKAIDDKVRARETLDAVAALALKAQNSTDKARTLLGVAHLYTKFDQVRAVEVMTEAVKTTNALTEPDLTSGVVQYQLEGETFGFYTMRNVPGFSLENAFRELGAIDFENALDGAQKLNDKSLRAIALVSLAASCLERKPEPRQPRRGQRAT
ncbi:MAG: hypothetical protein H0V27_11940 [Pyrinomonadaceae bacterium]|nr:hypothetical protein [Pyrinomonadaceae bacterium]